MKCLEKGIPEQIKFLKDFATVSLQIRLKRDMIRIIGRWSIRQMRTRKLVYEAWRLSWREKIENRRPGAGVGWFRESFMQHSTAPGIHFAARGLFWGFGQCIIKYLSKGRPGGGTLIRIAICDDDMSDHIQTMVLRFFRRKTAGTFRGMLSVLPRRCNLCIWSSSRF